MAACPVTVRMSCPDRRAPVDEDGGPNDTKGGDSMSIASRTGWNGASFGLFFPPEVDFPDMLRRFSLPWWKMSMVELRLC